MIALDTNVLVRAIASEPDADSAAKSQARKARALLASGRELFVPVTVIIELEWVLRSVYDMPRDDVAAVFDDLLAVENITVDRASAVSEACAGYRHGLDFSDALHLAQSRLCSSLATFDTRFAKTARRLKLEPPVEMPAVSD